MRLTHLLAELDIGHCSGDPEPVRIQKVTCHTDEVEPGSIFVCIRGLQHDGHRFVDEARRRGAAAIFVDKPLPSPPEDRIPVLRVKDTRRTYALLCAAAAGHPARNLHVTGITGTNGKTTTALFLDGIYRAAGLKTGLLTTVFSRIADKTLPQGLTTPEAGALQRLLAEMRTASVQRVVLETSSHGLHMHRITGTPLRTAIFTNLARDHLDFHGDRGRYKQTKARIFEHLDAQRGVAVVNGDDPAGKFYTRELAKQKGPSLVTYGMQSPTEDIYGTFDRDEPSFLHLRTPDGSMRIALPAPGLPNAYNALAAAAAAWTERVPLSRIAQGLAEASVPPGRFQNVQLGQPFRVVVDFAHNPTALVHSLRILRAGLKGRLHLVFGCKGDDGDGGKRRLMGRVAARYADEIFITTDNPLNECPRRIARAVAEGVAAGGGAGPSYRIILNRTEAIKRALQEAQAADVVLIAGRGHEQTQRFGKETIHLDDVLVASEQLREQGYSKRTGMIGAGRANNKKRTYKELAPS